MTQARTDEIQNQIRSIAVDLLEKGRVDGVLGFRQTALPYMTEPFVAKTPEDAAQLVFNSHCRMNLAAYLTPALLSKGEKGCLAVVAKACDSRNMVIQIQENRYTRNQVHIIGVPCTGMADKTKLLTAANGRIEEISESGQTLCLNPGQITLAKSDIRQSNCNTCIQRNPVIHDSLAGEPVEELGLGEDRFSDVKKIGALAPADKAAFFADLVSACTRCYACRNACPLCYCPTCFVDESRPQWVGKTTDGTDVMTYHLVRALHDAGRCTDCGACEAACPMDIPMRHFTRKTIMDTVTAYGSENGMDLEVRPVLDRFDLKDPEAFIQ